MQSCHGLSEANFLSGGGLAKLGCSYLGRMSQDYIVFGTLHIRSNRHWDVARYQINIAYECHLEKVDYVIHKKLYSVGLDKQGRLLTLSFTQLPHIGLLLVLLFSADA